MILFSDRPWQNQHTIMRVYHIPYAYNCKYCIFTGKYVIFRKLLNKIRNNLYLIMDDCSFSMYCSNRVTCYFFFHNIHRDVFIILKWNCCTKWYQLYTLMVFKNKLLMYIFIDNSIRLFNTRMHVLHFYEKRIYIFLCQLSHGRKP